MCNYPPYFTKKGVLNKMNKIKIHVLHTGKVCIAPNLAFGGQKSNIIKASGIFLPKSKRLWLPVSSYLIEHPKGKILVDCGWSREMSPNGIYNRKAQIKSLGSFPLYLVNQGVVPKGEAIHEQLNDLGITTNEIDYVLLTHLDCDHVNGLKQVSDAKKILVSKDELAFAKHSKIRYQKKWWENVVLTVFEWNDSQGVAKKSYDLFGDGSVELINIPGHSKGLFAVKIKNEVGKYVLLFSDGGYSSKSWKEIITSGIADDKNMQQKSLEWIREESLNPNCLISLANHDPNIKPQIIQL